MKATDASGGYFTARGLRAVAPADLNGALRAVLDTMPASIYGESAEGLTLAERQVLIEGGVNLDAIPEGDPLAKTVVRYAAIVESSLTTRQAAQRLHAAESRVRQMIARRTLYGILLDNRRHIPLFQFEKAGPLVANITQVNPALSPDLHPVEVYDWYTRSDPDLFLGDDVDAGVSPLAWLRSGGPPNRLAMLARRLRPTRCRSLASPATA